MIKTILIVVSFRQQENPMNKLSTMALLAALALGVATPSFAQTVTAPSGARASRLVGAPVYNNKGEQIATVEDVLQKDGSAEPTVVLSVDGDFSPGSKLIAVPLSHLNVSNTAPMVGTTKAVPLNQPAFVAFPVGGANG